MKGNKNISQADYSKKTYQVVNHKVTFLLGLLLFVFLSGILFYPEQFQFRNDALSYLGEIQPRNGKSNLLSFAIFNLGMIGCSLLFWSMSNDVKGEKAYYYFRIAALGFLLLAVPSDVSSILHSIGGATTVGSIWLFSSKTLNDLYRKTSGAKMIIYQFILQATVLPYAFLYFTGSSFRQHAQKFAIIGLMIILKIAVYERRGILEKEYEKSETGNAIDGSHETVT